MLVFTTLMCLVFTQQHWQGTPSRLHDIADYGLAAVSLKLFSMRPELLAAAQFALDCSTILDIGAALLRSGCCQRHIDQ